jgi:competence protein ComEC
MGLCDGKLSLAVGRWVLPGVGSDIICFEKKGKVIYMKKILFFVLIMGFGLCSLIIYQYFHFNDGKLHVVFCDVGQGDATLIITPNHKYILVDSGPDKRILDCLSRSMPFWQRTIDLAILTHPHSDHYSGYYYVLQRYNITHFVTENLNNKTAGFGELIRIIKDRKIPLQYVSAGDKWRIGEVTLTVAGPTKEFLNTTSPGGFIGEGKEFASVITKVSYGKFSALLTGDSQVSGLMDATDHILQTISVLQVPHHGSSSGLDEHILKNFQPQLAVISVGKNNYGHPTNYALQLLQEKGIKILRTDQQGSIEVVSDGRQLLQIR